MLELLTAERVKEAIRKLKEAESKREGYTYILPSPNKGKQLLIHGWIGPGEAAQMAKLPDPVHDAIKLVLKEQKKLEEKSEDKSEEKSDKDKNKNKKYYKNKKSYKNNPKIENEE